MIGRPAVALALIAIAALAAFGVWKLWQRPETGGERSLRSDYVLENYELVALDSAGREAFTVKGPHLERDPGGKSLSLRAPRFSFPDRKGGRWSASSASAWVADKATEVRLIDDVVMVGPPAPSGERTRFTTERLQIFPKSNLARSDDSVTVSRSDSILAGKGLRADIQAHRFQLLSDVKGRYAPPARR